MRVLLLLFCHLILISAQAQNDSVEKSLAEVVVTAQRTQQNIKLIPYAIAVVNKQSLEDFQPRTTPEALQGTNGVFVQKTNHGGGSPFIRGLIGNQTLLLIDGIRLNNATFRYGPNQYLNTVDAYTVDRIEVAKGTGSVQYGTDALGGVIHVLTKELQFSDRPAFHSSHTGKLMSLDMEKTLRNEASFSSKKLSVTGGITYRDFGHLSGGDTTGEQKPTGYSEWAFDGKAKIAVGRAAQLTLASQFLKQQHVPVYHKIVLENYRLNEFEVQQRSLQYARLVMQGQNNLLKHIELTTSWQQSIEGRKMQKNGSPVLTQEKDRINTFGFTAIVHSEIKQGWFANSGIDVYLDKVASIRNDFNTGSNIHTIKRGLYPDQSKHNSYSLYSLHHFSFNNWVIDAGLRLNYFSVTIKDSALGYVQINPSALVGNTGIMYRFSGRHGVYASYNTGFRAPNIDDMGTLGIVDFRYEVPSYNLRPEKSVNLEIGYKFHTKRISGDLAVYHMRLYNLITRQKLEGQIMEGYQTYQKFNSEKAFVRGLETEVAWKATSLFDVKAGIAYAYGQNKTLHEPLRRMPPLNGRLQTAFRKNNWFTAAECLFASRQARLAKGDKEDNRIPVGGTPGWQVVNMYAGYKSKVLHCSIGMQNIFNVDYRTHGSGINGVGRSFWLSVSMRL